MREQELCLVATAQGSVFFDECWALYEDAFPADERRELEYQLQTMERDGYHFDAIIDRGEFVGILGWWDFARALYVEHLAVSPAVRNGGYGRRVLSLLKSDSTKPIVLEVEHPDDELTKRRIGFYQREGFVLNPHHYEHPPYRGDGRVSLLVMSYPNPMSHDELERFKSDYFPLIHFR